MKRLIAEFEEQSFTQIVFPHKNSDWVEYLDEAIENFVEIIKAVIRFQKCVVIVDDIARVKKYFEDDKNLVFVEYETDDTWARDISALSVEDNNVKKLLNFHFNAWGGKFEYEKDDAMSRAICDVYDYEMIDVDFILEGGGVESNGVDAILTTTNSMLNKNRNKDLTKDEVTTILEECFGAKDIFYLNYGYLSGDDTDSHIDTLARFISEDKIIYVSCEDKNDEHYEELLLMKKELEKIASYKNYKLIPLPMPDAIYFDGERLPATYANFLFVNGAVLVPTYGVNQDIEAIEIFKDMFKDREIVPIDCSTLIKQHGSLHCVTMNFA